MAFLLLVVIEDTRDNDERVPERFRDVQWTRLPAGVTLLPSSSAYKTPALRALCVGRMTARRRTPLLNSPGTSAQSPESTSSVRLTRSHLHRACKESTTCHLEAACWPRLLRLG